MINYSIFTGEFIMSTEEKVKEKKVIEINRDIKLLVEETDKKDEYKILQVLSTDPQVFLRPDLNPGTIIKSRLQLN